MILGHRLRQIQHEYGTKNLVDPFGDSSGMSLYKFDGDATDEGGTYDGTPSNITYTTGLDGQCAVFSGSSSYISAPSYSAGTSFSYSVWLKPDVINTTSRYILDFSSSRTLLAACANSSTNMQYYAGGWTSLSYQLSTTTWQHACLVVAGTSLKLYINGSLITSTTTTATSLSGTLGIGSYWEGSSTCYDGYLEQLRIFNKALSSTEVGVLYHELD